MKGVNKKA